MRHVQLTLSKPNRTNARINEWTNLSMNSQPMYPLARFLVY